MHYGTNVLAAAIPPYEAHAGITRLIKFLHCHKALLGIDLDDPALGELARAYTAGVEEHVATCDGFSEPQDFLAVITLKFHYLPFQARLWTSCTASRIVVI